MPANLTPEYYKAEEEYRRASSPQERLEGLKKMLAAIPKHKGTDKMQADLKRRIAQAREEVQKAGKKKGFSIKVEREGGAQVTLAGPPNSGKSQLVSALTNTSLEVAPYPFTTRTPHPAMMPFEDIKIQLVDLPPVCSQHLEFWVPNIIRVSDFILIVVDLSSPNVLDELEDTLHVLEEHKIKPVNYKPEEDFWASVMEKRAWLVGNKIDVSGAQDNWEVLKELYFGRFGLSAVSATTGEGLERLKAEIVEALEIIRVYSKKPGKEPDMDQPFVLKKGSTLLDFAREVHKDFAENLKYARMWGHGKFEGQRVNRDYVLQDRDVIELHI